MINVDRARRSRRLAGRQYWPILVVDAATLSVGTRIALPATPRLLALTRDGRLLLPGAGSLARGSTPRGRR
ncbi:hypothetical protein [Streptomyces sp. NPDC093598]|uniref:hypothetical protein n=1 Tax=Streptomyces sp. NPDC093598 TaxID=3366046 RepID=UPI0037F64012